MTNQDDLSWQGQITMQNKNLVKLLKEARKIIKADCNARMGHEDFIQRSAALLKQVEEK